MSIFTPPKDPDWLGNAARHISHEVYASCPAAGGAGHWPYPREHTAQCDKLTDLIVRHMRAALALEREKTE